MKSDWKGDLSLFWKYESGNDYVDAVAVTCCNEAEGFDNRHLVESGAIYLALIFSTRLLNRYAMADFL